MKPRPYQARAIEQLRVHIRRSIRKLLLVAPTGSGKTVMAAAIIVGAIANGLRVLFFAHRRELIKQAFVKLVRSGVCPSKIGVILPGANLPRGHVQIPLGGFDALDDDEIWNRYAFRRPDAPVQVASIQTLARRELPDFDILIVDEAHRSRAASYEKAIAANDNAIVIGLTATPVRTDNKPLSAVYDEMVVSTTYAELVAEGFLVPCSSAWKPRGGELPDVSGVRLKGHDYDLVELGHACNKSRLVGGIVERWLEKGNNAPTFCFAAGVEHSKSIVERFLAAGVPAAHVDGNTPTEERERILRELANGTIKVVSNCDVCTEGTDVPAVKTIILARPTKSLRIYLQMVGRASRPHENGLPFVILDHAGVFDQPGFGPPQADRKWSLDPPKKNRKKIARKPVRTCLGCWAMVPLGSVACPGCGYEFPAPGPRTLQEVEEELEEWRSPTTHPERVEAYKLVCEQWRLENEARMVPLSPGWIWYQFKQRFAQQPPPGCYPPKLTKEQAAIKRRFDELKAIETANDHGRGWAFGQLERELARQTLAGCWERTKKVG